MDDPATVGHKPAPAGVAARPPGPMAQPVSRGLFALLVVALAAALLAAWIGLRNEQGAARLEVAQRLAEADAALAQARTRESEQAGELRDAQAKLALLEARLSESQTQQASLEALYRELAPSRDELALNEVEQVLLLASQQLAIARNVQAALAALQLAEAKLARVDRPQVVPLRRALARDIDRLKARALRRRRRHVAQARPGAVGDRHAAPRARRAPAPCRLCLAATRRRGPLAAARARSMGRDQVARAHRGGGPSRGSAGAAATAVFPAREPASAPARRTHRVALARRPRLQDRRHRRECVDQAVFRHASEGRAVAGDDADPARGNADAGGASRRCRQPDRLALAQGHARARAERAPHANR